jgi:hypothetical protein
MLHVTITEFDNLYTFIHKIYRPMKLSLFYEMDSHLSNMKHFEVKYHYVKKTFYREFVIKFFY